MVGPSLNEMVASAATKIGARRDGHLPLPVRDEICRRAVVGHVRPVAALIVLDVLVVAQVAYLAGGQAREVRAAVTDLAELAEAPGGEAALSARRDVCLSRADDCVATGDQRAAIVWFAAAGAVGGALAPEYLAEAPPIDVDDEEIDPDWWEPAFNASLAAAGGTPSDPDSDSELRRRFWWWWLRAAVPRATGIGLDPAIVGQVAAPAPLTGRAARLRARARTRSLDHETVLVLEHQLAHRASADSSWERDDLVAQGRHERLLGR